MLNTDKFLHVGNPGTATNLSAPGYTVGNTTINVASTADFPTDTAVIFGIDTATTSSGVQVRTPGSYCVFVGIVYLKHLYRLGSAPHRHTTELCCLSLNRCLYHCIQPAHEPLNRWDSSVR